MGQTKYDVSRIRIDVRYTGKVGNEAKKEKMNIFSDFCQIFEKQLSEYDSNILCVPSTGTVYGNNISLETPISINAVNQVIESVEENSKYSIKKTEYYIPTKLVVVTIVKLD